MASPDDPILIGTRYGYAQSVAPLSFTVLDRRQHVRLIGAPGTGKTELIRSMIAQDIAAGRGFAVIDGNGRLARAVLDLVPSSLTSRTALFAPGDTAYPVGLNIFDRSDDGDAADEAQLTVSHTVGAFKRIWPDSFLARSEDILANTVQALCELPDATFLSIPKMLNDPAYRARVVRHIRDPVIRQFWEVEYEGRGDRFNTEADAPVLNKVRRFLAVPLIRNIVGQRRSTINFRFMLDDSRIFIADLGQANAGEGETTLLGTLILASFTRAAHRRLAAENGDPPDFTLYINDFQNFSSSELARMLAICRDARVSLVIAYPYTSQLRQRRKRPLIERHGMGFQALEIIERQAHGRGPKHLLPVVLRKPQVEGRHNLRIDRDRAAVAHHPEAQRRRRQPRQLILDDPHVAAFGIEFQPFDEGGKAVLDLDFRRIAAQRFGVQVRQHQPGFWAERQQQIDKLPGFRMHGATRFHHQHSRALLPFPPPHIRAGITVRQRGLAQDRMLKGDRLFFVRFGQQARRFNDPILNDRLHLRQRQHALAERVKRPRRLAFPCPALIVQHPPPLRSLRVQTESPGRNRRGAVAAQLSPKTMCIKNLSTATLVRKPRPLWYVQARPLWYTTL
jgi:hypothetical protein